MHEMLEDAPVVVVTGARQVGKSSLVRHLCADLPQVKQVNLDEGNSRAAAEADPDAFVDQAADGLLAIDEIQRVPKLLLSIKASLERDRRPGRFIVTGSSNLHSLKGAEESLAGRAQSLNLQAFSQGELAEVKEDFASFVWGLADDTLALSSGDAGEDSRSGYLDRVLTSCFPEPALGRVKSQSRWLTNYVERILSRDAKNLDVVRYPERLEPILEWFAANPAAEHVPARLARDLDIPERSVPAYVRVLRDVFLVAELPAWSNRALKRVIGRPKVMFLDTGLAGELAGVDVPAFQANIASDLVGGLAENFVAAELLKQRSWSSIRFRLYHYRDRLGNEVDLIMEDRARRIVGIEVKATTSLSRNHFKGLRFLQEKTGDQFLAGVVLYLGNECFRFGPGLWALPLSSLWSHPQRS